MAKATTAAKPKAPAKVKAHAKKPIVKNSTKRKVKSTVKTAPIKARIPVPKGWPVSSKPKDSATNGEGILTPGNLLQVNCNGSDVFLRKRATQSSASLSLPTSSKSKGSTRFLVVFPGRLSLKPPEKKAVSKEENIEEKEADDEEAEELEDDVKDSSKKKSPFAPTNPPQLLGTLKETAGNHIQLTVPFSSESDKHLVFSGRAIPMEGKFLTLSFKRTGGKDSKKKSKMGTGSIQCKDVFRSVIVLGESKIQGDSKENVDFEAEREENEESVVRHYGGSDRTIDGGGSGDVASRKSFDGRRDSVASTKSISTKRSESESEINSDSDDGSVENREVDDLESDCEFVPARKKRKNGNDDDAVKSTEPKRSSRRSASKATNITYADEDSDVDMDSDEDSESEQKRNEDNANDSDDDEFDELLDNISRRSRTFTKPKVKKNGRAPSGRAESTKKEYIEIDSDEDSDDVVIIDSDSNSVRETTKTTKSPKMIANKKHACTTKQTIKNDTSTKAIKLKKSAVPSPPTKPISPRRRKKTSPHKSPLSSDKKKEVMDLSDDSFSFL